MLPLGLAAQISLKASLAFSQRHPDEQRSVAHFVTRRAADPGYLGEYYARR
jgi:hypothetical protein